MPKGYWKQFIPAAILAIVVLGWWVYGRAVESRDVYLQSWYQAGYAAGLEAGQIRGGNIMASWYVGAKDGVGTDPGDATYKGLYVESGTYNLKPKYTNGSRWLFWILPGYMWVLADEADNMVETIAYESDWMQEELPANDWTVASGTGPAPTVAEGGESPPSGGGSLSKKRPPPRSSVHPPQAADPKALYRPGSMYYNSPIREL